MARFETQNGGQWFVVDTTAGTRTPISGPGGSPIGPPIQVGPPQPQQPAAQPAFNTSFNGQTYRIDPANNTVALVTGVDANGASILEPVTDYVEAFNIARQVGVQLRQPTQTEIEASVRLNTVGPAPAPVAAPEPIVPDNPPIHPRFDPVNQPPAPDPGDPDGTRFGDTPATGPQTSVPPADGSVPLDDGTTDTAGGGVGVQASPLPSDDSRTVFAFSIFDPNQPNTLGDFRRILVGAESQEAAIGALDRYLLSIGKKDFSFRVSNLGEGGATDEDVVIDLGGVPVSIHKDVIFGTSDDSTGGSGAGNGSGTGTGDGTGDNAVSGNFSGNQFNPSELNIEGAIRNFIDGLGPSSGRAREVAFTDLSHGVGTFNANRLAQIISGADPSGFGLVDDEITTSQLASASPLDVIPFLAGQSRQARGENALESLIALANAAPFDPEAAASDPRAAAAIGAAQNASPGSNLGVQFQNAALDALMAQIGGFAAQQFGPALLQSANQQFGQRQAAGGPESFPEFLLLALGLGQ